jgi:hypothetical protein
VLGQRFPEREPEGLPSLLLRIHEPSMVDGGLDPATRGHLVDAERLGQCGHRHRLGLVPRKGLNSRHGLAYRRRGPGDARLVHGPHEVVDDGVVRDLGDEAPTVVTLAVCLTEDGDRLDEGEQAAEVAENAGGATACAMASLNASTNGTHTSHGTCACR